MLVTAPPKMRQHHAAEEDAIISTTKTGASFFEEDQKNVSIKSKPFTPPLIHSQTPKRVQNTQINKIKVKLLKVYIFSKILSEI